VCFCLGFGPLGIPTKARSLSEPATKRLPLIGVGGCSKSHADAGGNSHADAGRAESTPQRHLLQTGSFFARGL